jgi:hypothetical protein
MGPCLSREQQWHQQQAAQQAAAKHLLGPGADKPNRFVTLFGDGKQLTARPVEPPKHGDAEQQEARQQQASHSSMRSLLLCPCSSL